MDFSRARGVPRHHRKYQFLRGRRLALLFGPMIFGIITAEKGSEFQKAINQQANPEVNNGPQIDGPRMVLRGGRQVGCQGKIQRISEHNGHQVFYQFGARKRHGSQHFGRPGSGCGRNQEIKGAILDPPKNFLCSPARLITRSPDNLLSRL